MSKFLYGLCICFVMFFCILGVGSMLDCIFVSTIFIVNTLYNIRKELSIMNEKNGNKSVNKTYKIKGIDLKTGKEVFVSQQKFDNFKKLDDYMKSSVDYKRFKNLRSVEV